MTLIMLSYFMLDQDKDSKRVDARSLCYAKESKLLLYTPMPPLTM